MVVDPASNRLQLLEPFTKWNGGDITDAQVRPALPLVASLPFCTTSCSQISAHTIQADAHLYG